MLVNDDKKGRKKRKDYQRAMAKKKSRSRAGRRWLPVGAGGLLSVAAVVLMAVGVISFTVDRKSTRLNSSH